MPIFCKQCGEEIVNGEKCVCISEGVMHGTEFDADSWNDEDQTYLHSRCVKNEKHLCETCKNKDECGTCGEIDNFDEVLAAMAEHKNDEDVFDVVLTAIVVKCAKYEVEG